MKILNKLLRHRGAQVTEASQGPVKELVAFEALAREVGKERLQREGDFSTEYVRVGDFKLNLTSEYSPGEPIAFRLKAGVTYRVTLEDLGKPFTSFKELPRDSRLGAGLVFTNKAQPVSLPDEEDARRSHKNILGIWTDGISLDVDTRQLPLKKEWLYRVSVQVVADPLNKED